MILGINQRVVFIFARSVRNECVAHFYLKTFYAFAQSHNFDSSRWAIFGYNEEKKQDA